MTVAEDRLDFVGAIAAELDRLHVRAFDHADAYPAKPPAVGQLKAFPHLLNFASLILLGRAIGREDVARIVPFTPRALVDGLIDNNIDEGVVTEQDGELTLTDQGREAAEGFVHVQESAIAQLWSGSTDRLTAAEPVLTEIVQHGREIGPLRTPSNFDLFAPLCDRPTLEARVLRLIAAVRYWRSDAHARALADSDLHPYEGHALNVLWDRHRGVERIGQGFPEPGRKGVTAIEERGLAEGGEITAMGIEVRERMSVRRTTSRRRSTTRWTTPRATSCSPR